MCSPNSAPARTRSRPCSRWKKRRSTGRWIVGIAMFEDEATRMTGQSREVRMTEAAKWVSGSGATMMAAAVMARQWAAPSALDLRLPKLYDDLRLPARPHGALARERGLTVDTRRLSTSSWKSRSSRAREAGQEEQASRLRQRDRNQRTHQVHRLRHARNRRQGARSRLDEGQDAVVLDSSRLVTPRWAARSVTAARSSSARTLSPSAATTKVGNTWLHFIEGEDARRWLQRPPCSWMRPPSRHRAPPHRHAHPALGAA